MVLGVEHKCSGTSNASATSNGSGRSSNGGVIQPTTGWMRKPVTVWYSGQLAEDADPRRIEADLLLGLAQRRGRRVLVIGLDAPAEADLAGMVAQVLGALGEEERRPPRARPARPAPQPASLPPRAALAAPSSPGTAPGPAR